MECKKIQIEIVSCYEHIPLVSQGICTMVRHCHDNSELLVALELCCVEVSNNSIEHAYLNDKSQKISFELTISSSEVSLTVIDSGLSMKPGTLETDLDWSTFDKGNIDLLKTSGRGLQIVKDLMDEVSYWTDSGKNYFKMVKKIT